jgi:hypothetical protein
VRGGEERLLGGAAVVGRGGWTKGVLGAAASRGGPGEFFYRHDAHPVRPVLQGVPVPGWGAAPRPNDLTHITHSTAPPPDPRGEVPPPTTALQAGPQPRAPGAATHAPGSRVLGKRGEKAAHSPPQSTVHHHIHPSSPPGRAHPPPGATRSRRAAPSSAPPPWSRPPPRLSGSWVVRYSFVHYIKPVEPEPVGRFQSPYGQARREVGRAGGGQSDQEAICLFDYMPMSLSKRSP